MKHLPTSLSFAASVFIACIVVLQTNAQSPRTRRQPPKVKATAQDSTAFDKAAKDADDARVGGRLDDAIASYTAALRIRPTWPDGWWYLGALFYEKDQYPAARDAFKHLVDLEPKRGPAWGMLGLCLFQTREYEPAVVSLQRGRALGLDGNQELESVVRYHAALLYIRFGEFEIGYEILREFVRVSNFSPKVTEAFGLVMLRMPYLPNEVPADKREEVLVAGQAGISMAARRLDQARAAFDTLLNRYPTDPNVHYSYGVFQLPQDADVALKEFQRVLELDPNYQPAMVQMAFEYLKRDQYNDALPLAERSVQLAPKMYPARNVLGRVLLELGQTDRAVKELEEGVRLAPSSPEMHFALARAYTRAGRKQDADRERQTFKALQDKDKQQDDAARSGSPPVTNTQKPNPE
jgi:tetratricopeptide (TPR) repeat protein